MNDSKDFPQQFDVNGVPMFTTGGLRKFAVAELGHEAVGKSTSVLLRLLTAKGKREDWSQDRQTYKDKCRLCAWEGQHATLGKLWHITKEGDFYENPKRTGMRPNFRYSSQFDAWVCLKCIRESFPHHTDSA